MGRLTVIDYFNRGLLRQREESLPVRGALVASGDQLTARFSLQVENGRIRLARFRSSTCVTLVAYCALLVESVEALAMTEASRIAPAELAGWLPGVPQEKQDRAALAIHDEAGMAALRKKSLAMTEFFLAQLDQLPAGRVSIISPREAHRRGSQISLRIHGDGPGLHQALSSAAVFSDFRHPDVIRMAAAPLYNRFHELWRVAEILREHLS